MKYIFGLVKFFEKQEYMDDFLNGNLYMNSLKYFQDLENDTARSDSKEAVSHCFQPDTVKIQFNEITIESNELAGAVIVQTKEFNFCNIFCLYAINNGNFQELHNDNYSEFINSHQIHEKNKEFGKFCVLIHNVESFLERIKEAVLKKNFSMKANFVNYYDLDSFSGSFNGIDAIFHKYDKFSYQNEYRIMIDNKLGNDSPYSLNIGDMRDICSVSSIDAINSAKWNLQSKVELK